jgi:hypothetical protein
MGRVDDYRGQKHREGRLCNGADAKGYADKRPKVRIRNHTDLWPIEYETHRGCT